MYIGERKREEDATFKLTKLFKVKDPAPPIFYLKHITNSIKYKFILIYI